VGFYYLGVEGIREKPNSAMKHSITEEGVGLNCEKGSIINMVEFLSKVKNGL
jgi:hypothetical protein